MAGDHHEPSPPPPERRGKHYPPLSLRDVKQGRYHTLRDACQLLVPPATVSSLNRWADDLHITIYKSPIQGHSFLIAHKDLVTIASLVGRDLQEAGQEPRRRRYERKHPDDLETQQAREIAALRGQIEALKERHAREIEALKREHAREMDVFRQELVAVQQKMGEQPHAYVPPELVKPHAIPPGLPEGTIFMRWFLRPHGTTRELMTAAARRGDIRAIALPYTRQEKTGTQYFLDPSMQDEAVAWLVKMGYGHRCEHCPHAYTDLIPEREP